VTEVEWRACTDPAAMLSFVRPRATHSKVLAFACACDRLMGHLARQEEAEEPPSSTGPMAEACYPDLDDGLHAEVLRLLRRARASWEHTFLCGLLRDLFNPFRAATLDQVWLAPCDHTVRCLARAIYDQQAFERLPILADALEDAGCDNADLLSHLRGPGPHVRGCWALDLILGQS
jgi:hypothetical protein